LTTENPANILEQMSLAVKHYFSAAEKVGQENIEVFIRFVVLAR